MFASVFVLERLVPDVSKKYVDKSKIDFESKQDELTGTPSTADSCLALSDSSMQVLERNTTGTFICTNFWIAILATGMKLGPFIMTPSISKKQAKLG
jgi:hypothetical protein